MTVETTTIRNALVIRDAAKTWRWYDAFGENVAKHVTSFNSLPADAKVLVQGLVLKGMKPDDLPNLDKPIMPIVWTREYETDRGQKTKALCSTIASAVDFESEDLRRLVVNGCYWLLDMGDQVPKRANVNYVDDFQPSFYGRDTFVKGRTPADYRLGE